jgi:hypothetical protein
MKIKTQKMVMRRQKKKKNAKKSHPAPTHHDRKRSEEEAMKSKEYSKQTALGRHLQRFRVRHK